MYGFARLQHARRSGSRVVRTVKMTRNPRRENEANDEMDGASNGGGDADGVRGRRAARAETETYGDTMRKFARFRRELRKLTRQAKICTPNRGEGDCENMQYVCSDLATD